MAVSKRLRFEILRRDNNTCRYCGRTAPEVRLTVDHVLPVALGGRDEPTNLVACCSDCNSGKTSTTPDAPLLANVQEDALRWGAALHVAVEQASADLQAQLAYRRRFLEVWESWKVTYGGSSKPLPLDDGWEGSVENFRERGLPLEVLLEDVRKAMAANHVKPDNTFRYLCGIAWKEIEKIEGAARVMFESRTQDAGAPSLHDRAAAAVVEAAVLIWHTQWRQAHGAEPPEGLEIQLREHAVEMYPDEISASRLMGGAELAADMKSASLREFTDDEEETFEAQVAHALAFGWTYQHEAAPTPDVWTAVIAQALSAHVAGYSDWSVTAAVESAAANGSLDVLAALDTPADPDVIADMAQQRALTQAELDGYFGNALAMRSAARRAREEREARGEAPTPWDF